MTERTHHERSDTDVLASPYRLLVKCPDGPGIVAAVTGFLFEFGANIVSANQHSTDPRDGSFFLRLEFSLDRALTRDEFAARFQPSVAERFDMQWTLTDGRPKRLALLVSKYDHCLVDLLWRAQVGSLNAVVPIVVSNHADLEQRAAMFGVPFVHVPVSNANRAEQENALHEMMLENRIDAIVLARYMQVLSPTFVSRWPNLIINIHHSFLPAFSGASPYAAAFRRGVKIVGATAHYVTNDLDEGPIIEQDVVRVTHADSVADLTRLGRDVERQTLARAVEFHLADRIVVMGNTTLIL
jgi:formyltetrahydrofolate deformylase